MDLLSRLYRIARAYATVDESEMDSDQSATKRGYDGREKASFGASPDRESEPDACDPVLEGYYANLEIPYGSDFSRVKAAWKEQMKRYHPDRHSQDPEKRKVANELCAELTRAYQELERSLSSERNNRSS